MATELNHFGQVVSDQQELFIRSQEQNVPRRAWLYLGKRGEADQRASRRTESFSITLRTASTAATFRTDRFWASCSLENRQFLNWVLPS